MTKEELNKLLLAQEKKRRTVWSMAAHGQKVEVLDKLLDWAKEVLNPDKFKKVSVVCKKMMKV